MKRFVLFWLPLAALACAAGCDEAWLPDESKTLVGAHAISEELLQLQTQAQTPSQFKLQLQDGTCAGESRQHGASNDGGGPGGNGGNGEGDRDRLRDGSCGG